MNVRCDRVLDSGLFSRFWKYFLECLENLITHKTMTVRKAIFLNLLLVWKLWTVVGIYIENRDCCFPEHELAMLRRFVAILALQYSNFGFHGKLWKLGGLTLEVKGSRDTVRYCVSTQSVGGCRCYFDGCVSFKLWVYYSRWYGSSNVRCLFSLFTDESCLPVIASFDKNIQLVFSASWG